VTSALADDESSGENGEETNEFLGELHKVSASTLFVGLHVGYPLIFRRRYALSMFFVDGIASAIVPKRGQSA
jgi:hypothetical protein